MDIRTSVPTATDMFQQIVQDLPASFGNMPSGHMITEILHHTIKLNKFLNVLFIQMTRYFISGTKN